MMMQMQRMGKTCRFRQLLAVVLSTLMLLGALAAAMPYAAAAANYRGAGTKQSPYLVETAEQLNGIRNDLKAHYKLANTIDMSSIANFSPIGYLAKPFTGSLTCDTDANGNPKYAIKNMKQSVKSMADSIKQWYDASKWVPGQGRMEAGLFGASKGAEFSNVLILDFSIENKNPQMNAGGNFNGQYYNPLPANESGSGALVGIASNTTINGCAAVGTLTGSANYTGGLVGQLLEGSNASNCYVNAKLETTGWWGQGGLIGSVQDSTVSQSWCIGTVANNTDNNGKKSDNIGGFIGSIERSVVSDCYTATDVIPNGYNFSCQTRESVITNCYTAGKSENIRDPRPAEYAYGNHENCYVLQGTKNLQQDFKTASASDISGKLVGKTVWVAGANNLPTLSSVKIPKAASGYVPGAVEAPAPTDDKPAPGDIPGNKVPVDSLASRLNQYQDDANLITLENKNDIMQLKKDFDATEAAGAELDVALIRKMDLLYNAISECMLRDIGDRLQALPEVSLLTIEHKKEVLAIKSDFDFIGEKYQQSLVAELKTKLDEAVAKMSDLKAADTNTTMIINDKLNVVEWIIVAVLSLLIAAILAAVIWMSVIVVKTKNKQSKSSGGNVPLR